MEIALNSHSNKNITGKSAFISLLKQEGVTHLFGNPGTTELPIMDALTDHPDLNYVLGLQEATVVAMADGFSRATGRLTACNYLKLASRLNCFAGVVGRLICDTHTQRYGNSIVLFLD